MSERPPFHRLGNPKKRDALGADPEARNRATLASIANQQFVTALLRYGVKHGLPNMSADQCRAKLASLGGVSSMDGAAG